VRKSQVSALSLKAGYENQTKMEKIKNYEGFPVNFNSQRVKLDLPVTQKIETNKSKKEIKFFCFKETLKSIENHFKTKTTQTKFLF
jgi:hypothetical protein